MPLYDFECLECQNFFEKDHPRGADNPPCPLCTGKTEKRISPPPVIFKGGGFYKTDSNTKSKKKTAAAEISNTNQEAAGSPKEQSIKSGENEAVPPKISEKTGNPEPKTKE